MLRFVNFVLPEGASKGQIRPAIVVREWEGTHPRKAQLHVLLDEASDHGAAAFYSSAEQGGPGQPGTWFPEQRPPLSDEIMQYFTYAHLPAHLQEVSARIGKVAEWAVTAVPRNPERTMGLRKLLEAKDCFVRAALPPTKTS